ncbi:hypothetical protein GA0115240_10583 [Streptomyces sp. DvalAA-14]|uniref:hypothetical protein n=1 Tax=unclassified Streptomyces TaxID=2593676 RepID=UPI00081B4354|nr:MULTISPECIES: hypothetical protein [unclassified Streptomyces]MYS19152.1 hypothetical protein [Streptomyces sp. SID4948]SCD37980.1 hypothetical protein GA0115240_10583 [Streptomyces sp. DvalAA-14]
MPADFLLATNEEIDAAKRLQEAVELHLSALGDEAHGHFIAVRLSDGRSDGVLYDTRRDAARHQVNDPWCFYVKLHVGGIGLREAWTVLIYARQARKAGVVFSEEEAILPHRLELAGGDTAARGLPEMFRGMNYVG